MTKVADGSPRAPKRFYGSVSVEEHGGEHFVLLDGKRTRTRAGNPLAARSQRLARAIADEWSAQGDAVDFSAMPMTRFSMTVLDRAEGDSGAWRKAILAFLGSDLVCYRAAAPQALVERQRRSWDPLIDWAALALGTRLATGAGVGFIEQPAPALQAAEAMVEAMRGATLLAAREAAEISGSAVIALALAHRAFPPEELFAASRIDEEFQASCWGEDAEAASRARRLKRDFLDAARFLDLA